MTASATVAKGAYVICVFRNSLMNYLAAFTYVTYFLIKPSETQGCHVIMLYIDSCKMCPTNFLKLSRNVCCAKIAKLTYFDSCFRKQRSKLIPIIGISRTESIPCHVGLSGNVCLGTSRVQKRQVWHRQHFHVIVDFGTKRGMEQYDLHCLHCL